jgi:hypothetical protein
MEHMRKIKTGEGEGNYNIDKPLSPLPLFLHFFHIKKVELKLQF